MAGYVAMRQFTWKACEQNFKLRWNCGMLWDSKSEVPMLAASLHMNLANQ